MPSKPSVETLGYCQKKTLNTYLASRPFARRHGTAARDVLELLVEGNVTIPESSREGGVVVIVDRSEDGGRVAIGCCLRRQLASCSGACAARSLGWKHSLMSS